MRTEQIHNGMDIIDSRDIIARHSELQELRDDCITLATEIKDRILELSDRTGTIGWDLDSLKRTVERLLVDCQEDRKEELEGLKDKLEEIWVCEKGDWIGYDLEYGEDEESEFQALNSFVEDLPSDGEACIRDSYFETYAQELAEEIGAIGRNARWPLNHIDWEAAADELKTDYSSFEWDEVTYWYRDC